MNTYFKVIVIKCDPFESEIIDERTAGGFEICESVPRSWDDCSRC